MSISYFLVTFQLKQQRVPITREKIIKDPLPWVFLQTGLMHLTLSKVSTVIILIIARAFIRDTAFFKVGGGRLLEV